MSQQFYRISTHLARNLLGNIKSNQLTTKNNLSKNKKKENFGSFNFNLEQYRVIEAVLKLVSTFHYNGNMKPVPTYKWNIPEESINKNIGYLQKFFFTPKYILEFVGIKRNQNRQRISFFRTLQELAKSQFYFKYIRKTPLKNRYAKKKREYNEELVEFHGKLFTLKKVYMNKTQNRVKYFELILGPIFLDQVNSFFLMVPGNWAEEARNIHLNKRLSPIIFKLILFFVWQFEMKRPKGKKISTNPDNYIFTRNFNDLAVTLRIPESVFRGQRNRTLKMLVEKLELLKTLNFLKDFQVIGEKFIFELNSEKYFIPGQDL